MAATDSIARSIAAFSPFAPTILLQHLRNQAAHELDDATARSNQRSNRRASLRSSLTVPLPMGDPLPPTSFMSDTLHPSAMPVSGCLAILDVTGFTALTERLTQGGGTWSGELLISCLNSYFSAMEAILFEYGGDVIKFAGDAMICFFDARGDGNMDETEKRARLQCAAQRAISAVDRIMRELGEVEMLPNGKIRSLVINPSASSPGDALSGLLLPAAVGERPTTIMPSMVEKINESVDDASFHPRMSNPGIFMMTTPATRAIHPTALLQRRSTQTAARNNNNPPAAHRPTPSPALAAQEVNGRTSALRSLLQRFFPLVARSKRVNHDGDSPLPESDGQRRAKSVDGGRATVTSPPPPSRSLVRFSLRFPQGQGRHSPDVADRAQSSGGNKSSRIAPDQSERKRTSSPTVSVSRPSSQTPPPSRFSGNFLYRKQHAQSSTSPFQGPFWSRNKRCVPPLSHAGASASALGDSDNRDDSSKRESSVNKEPSSQVTPLNGPSIDMTMHGQKLGIWIHGEFKLAIKVICAVGEMYAYHVGYDVDPAAEKMLDACPREAGRWEMFLGDGEARKGGDGEAVRRPPMQQLMDLEPLATRCRILMSHEVYDLLSDTLSAERIKGGGQDSAMPAYQLISIHPQASPPAFSPLAPPPPLTDRDALRRYLHHLKSHVPRCVMTSITDTHREYASEIRFLSCVFVGFPDLVNPPPLSISPSNMAIAEANAAIQRIQQAFRLVDHSVSLYQGELLQMRCDEKGFLAVCAFGLSGRTHSDDGSRALLAALSIVQRGRKTGVAAVAGVTSGVLLCSFVGGAARCEYTIFGSAINLSARLMVEAKKAHLARDKEDATTDVRISSQVLCDERTYHLAQGRAQFTPILGIKLKGQMEGTKVFGAESLRRSSVRSESDHTPIPLPPPPMHATARFIGRTIPLKTMEGIVRSVMLEQAPSRIVVISGNQGIGKSRFLQHALGTISSPAWWANARRGDKAGAVPLFVMVHVDKVGGQLSTWRRLLRQVLRALSGFDTMNAEEDNDAALIITPSDGATPVRTPEFISVPANLALRSSIFIAGPSQRHMMSIEDLNAAEQFMSGRDRAKSSHLHPHVSSQNHAMHTEDPTSTHRGRLLPTFHHDNNSSGNNNSSNASPAPNGRDGHVYPPSSQAASIQTSPPYQMPRSSIHSSNETTPSHPARLPPLHTSGDCNAFAASLNPSTRDFVRDVLQSLSLTDRQFFPWLCGHASCPEQENDEEEKEVDLDENKKVDEENFFVNRDRLAVSALHAPHLGHLNAPSNKLSPIRGRATPTKDENSFQGSDPQHYAATPTAIGSRMRRSLFTSLSQPFLLPDIKVPSKRVRYADQADDPSGSTPSGRGTASPKVKNPLGSSWLVSSRGSALFVSMPLPRMRKEESGQGMTSSSETTTTDPSLVPTETSSVPTNGSIETEPSLSTRPAIVLEPPPAPSPPSQPPSPPPPPPLTNNSITPPYPMSIGIPSSHRSAFSHQLSLSTRHMPHTSTTPHAPFPITPTAASMQTLLSSTIRNETQLIVHLLHAIVRERGGIVIGLDQMDRLDPPSLLLLDLVLQGVDRGLVVAATMQEGKKHDESDLNPRRSRRSNTELADNTIALQRLINSQQVERMTLAPLTRHETEELVTAMLGPDLHVASLLGGETDKNIDTSSSSSSSSSSIVPFVFERTQGHVLHTEQLLLLIKQGLEQDIPMEDLHYLLMKSTGVSAVLLHRIDSLRPGLQLTLKLASVIGLHFDMATLHRIHPLQPSLVALQGQLTTLIHLAFIVREEYGGASFRFASELTRSLCYQLWPAVQRGAVHQSCAVALHERLEHGKHIPAAVLALHLTRSLANVDKSISFRLVSALDAVERAAHDALEQHAYENAIDFLDEMDALLQHPLLDESLLDAQGSQSKQAALHLGTAEAHMGLGAIDTACSHVAASLEALGHQDYLAKPSKLNAILKKLSIRGKTHAAMPLPHVPLLLKALEISLDLRILLDTEPSMPLAQIQPLMRLIKHIVLNLGRALKQAMNTLLPAAIKEGGEEKEGLEAMAQRIRVALDYV